MALDKNKIRILALSERLMDEGKLKWVMAPSPSQKGMMERLPVSDDVMEELGLQNGQTINTIIMDAIVEASIKSMLKMVEKSRQEYEDKDLDESFDFRKMMGEDDEPTTKH